jgi:rod shape-determining protein MreC
LIGKVVEVNYITSRVLLISDLNFKLPITIQPLDIEAIMSGHDQQNGKLQYIRGEKIIDENDKELGVVTSGSGGVFKSGIPVGTIDLTNTSKNDEIIVNFYRDFTQLKYVKILSYKKESTQLDQNNKIEFEERSKQIIEINSQDKDIKVLQQQKIINEEIRNKFEIENTKLKENLINTQKEVEKQKNKLKEIQVSNQDIEFLELNLLYGHKCRKTFLRPKLFKINTLEYRTCVLSKEIVKNN